MITVELIDNASVRLKALPEETRKRLRVVIIRDGKELAARVRQKLSGPVLKIRSGRLLNSIRAEMVENKDAVYGRVFSHGVPYAAIHEYGGKTRPHVIVPVRAQALHFFVGGREVFTQRVNHPGSRMPERSYLRSSLADLKARLVGDITEAGRPQWR